MNITLLQRQKKAILFAIWHIWHMNIHRWHICHAEKRRVHVTVSQAGHSCSTTQHRQSTTAGTLCLLHVRLSALQRNKCSVQRYLSVQVRHVSATYSISLFCQRHQSKSPSTFLRCTRTALPACQLPGFHLEALTHCISCGTITSWLWLVPRWRRETAQQWIEGDITPQQLVDILDTKGADLMSDNTEETDDGCTLFECVEGDM